VLELDWLNDEEKALAMMFVLTAVREYARSTRRSGAKLTHVLVLEEAHNVIGRGEGTGGGDNVANPKQVAVRFFTRMLAEMRALGEGMIVADQLPTAVASEAIKNTNVKVMHRLVSVDDRQELGNAMILDEGQVELAAALPPGRSLVHMEGWPKSRLVAEPDFKAQHGIEEGLEDTAVQERMAAVRREKPFADCYLPFHGCQKLCRECSLKIREEVERFALGVRAALPAKLAGEPPEYWDSIARDEYLEAMKARGMIGGSDLSADAQVRMFCAVIHLDETVLRRLAGSER